MSETILTPGGVTTKTAPKKSVMEEVYEHAVANFHKKETTILTHWDVDTVVGFVVLLTWLRNHLNYEKTSRDLNMGRATVYRKIASMGVDRHLGGKLIIEAGAKP